MTGHVKISGSYQDMITKGILDSVFSADDFIEKAKENIKKDIQRSCFVDFANKTFKTFEKEWTEPVITDFSQGNITASIFNTYWINSVQSLADWSDLFTTKNDLSFAYYDDNNQVCGFTICYSEADPSLWTVAIIKNTTAPKVADREVVLYSPGQFIQNEGLKITDTELEEDILNAIGNKQIKELLRGKLLEKANVNITELLPLNTRIRSNQNIDDRDTKIIFLQELINNARERLPDNTLLREYLENLESNMKTDINFFENSKFFAMLDNFEEKFSAACGSDKPRIAFEIQLNLIAIKLRISSKILVNGFDLDEFKKQALINKANALMEQMQNKNSAIEPLDFEQIRDKATDEIALELEFTSLRDIITRLHEPLAKSLMQTFPNCNLPELPASLPADQEEKRKLIQRLDKDRRDATNLGLILTTIKNYHKVLETIQKDLKAAGFPQDYGSERLKSIYATQSTEALHDIKYEIEGYYQELLAFQRCLALYNSVKDSKPTTPLFSDIHALITSHAEQCTKQDWDTLTTCLEKIQTNDAELKTQESKIISLAYTKALESYKNRIAELDKANPITPFAENVHIEIDKIIKSQISPAEARQLIDVLRISTKVITKPDPENMLAIEKLSTEVKGKTSAIWHKLGINLQLIAYVSLYVFAVSSIVLTFGTTAPAVLFIAAASLSTLIVSQAGASIESAFNKEEGLAKAVLELQQKSTPLGKASLFAVKTENSSTSPESGPQIPSTTSAK